MKKYIVTFRNKNASFALELSANSHVEAEDTAIDACKYANYDITKWVVSSAIMPSNKKYYD